MSSKNNIQDIYALTPMQHGMLFHAMLHGTTAMYFKQKSYRIRANLDIVVVEESVYELSRRHDILRAAFVSANQPQPLQVILKDRKIGFAFIDLTNTLNITEAIEQYKCKDRERGFDLIKDPLMRVSLLKTGSSEFEFIWSHHHILMDGWCTNILIQEFYELYGALLHQRAHTLETPVPFGHYISWLQKQDKTASGKYWTDYLLGFEGSVSLPPNNKGKIKDGPYRRREITVALSVAVTGQLSQMAAAHHVTLNTVCQALWAILLGKYNRCYDVVFGTVVSGRPNSIAGIEKMIGLFINTIPVRVHFLAEDRFSTLITKVQNQALESEPFHYYPLADIQAGSALKQALIDHILVFENFPTEIPVLGDQEQEVAVQIGEEQVFEQTNYDLNIIIYPGHTLKLVFQFNESVYDAGELRQAGQYFTHIANQVIADPDRRVGSLTLFDSNQQQMLLTAFNNTARSYSGKNFIQLFIEQVNKNPDAVALACNGNTCSYKRLHTDADKLAYQLVNNHGVKKGDCIAVTGKRSIELVSAIIGIMKAGAVFLPVDSSYPPARIEYILKDAGVTLVLTCAMKDCENLPSEGFSILPAHNILSFEHERHTFTGDDHSLSDLAYIIYTSGSTGYPKGVEIEMSSLTNYLLWANEYYFRNGNGYAFGFFTSLSFDLTITSIFTTLLRGDCLHVYDDDDVASLLTTVFSPSSPVNTAKLTPSHIAMLEVLRLTETNVQVVIVGGEALMPGHVKTLRRLNANIGIYNEYGPTEATVGCTVQKVDTLDDVLTIGKPIANTAIYILDDQLNILPPGFIGEIAIGGSGLARGYRNKPELTAEKFISDKTRMYLSGDLGKWLPDGSIIYLSRKDSEVKIRGYRIQPGEISVALSSFPGVKEAQVIAVNRNNETHLVAYYISPVTLHADALRQYLVQLLPSYMIPACFVQIGCFPLTPNGKIDLKSLPEPLWNTRTRSQQDIPANRIEATLQLIWQGVTGLNHIPVNKNLFDIGAHSLHAVQVMSKIHRQYNVQLGIRGLFERPSIREQTSAIQHLQREEWEGLTPVPDQPYYDLSPAQKRMWLLEQVQENQTAFIIAGAYRIKGKLDTNVFLEAVRSLIKRHQSLRTTFIKTTDGVKQLIHDFDPCACDIVFEDHSLDLQTGSYAASLIDREQKTPFDLVKKPPFRSRLLKLGEADYLYVVALHHIIADGWSVEIIKNELLQLYNTYSKGFRDPLSPLSIQYKDYVGWLQKKLSDNSLQQMKQYWSSVFADDCPVLNMTTDFQRPAVRTFNGASARYTIDKDLLDGLYSIARQHSASLFASLMSCVVVLLYKYSGQRDITIGTDITGRIHADLENQVGLYLNTLALRTKFDSAETFSNLLTRVKENFWDAQEYQLYPLDQLIADLQIPSHADRLPLFDTFLLLQNIDEKSLNGAIAGNIEIEEYMLPTRTAKFDLTFIFKETQDGLQLLLEYNTNLYLPETIEGIFNNLKLIMQHLVAKATDPVSVIKINRNQEELAFEAFINTNYEKFDNIHQ